MNSNAHEEELNLQALLNFWLTKEEDEIRQKSRENWLHLGDRNTIFFLQCLQGKDVGKQSVCSDTNCCDFRGGRLYDQIDWGGAVETNHRIY